MAMAGQWTQIRRYANAIAAWVSRVFVAWRSGIAQITAVTTALFWVKSQKTIAVVNVMLATNPCTVSRRPYRVPTFAKTAASRWARFLEATVVVRVQVTLQEKTASGLSLVQQHGRFSTAQVKSVTYKLAQTCETVVSIAL